METVQQIRQQSGPTLVFLISAMLIVSGAILMVLVGDWVSVTIALSVAVLIALLILHTAAGRDFSSRREFVAYLVDIHRPSLKHVGYAILVVALGMGVKIGVSLLKAAVATETQAAGHSAVAGSPPGTEALLLLALFVIVIGPLLEEIIFRGIAQRFLAAHIPVFGAIIAVSLTFAVLHIPSYGGFETPLDELVFPMLIIFADSCLWGYLYAKTRNVTISFIAHALTNAIAMVAWIV